jgi:hypothetical protein
MIQFGSYGAPTDDGSFREMTAVWMEIRSTPLVKDYVQYVGKYLKKIGSIFSHISVDDSYGQSIFLKYLSGKFKDSIVRNVWEYYSTVQSNFLKGFDAVLTNHRSSFCSEYKDFGSELMTALMQDGSRLHQGQTTLPDLELYPHGILPIAIISADTTVTISPASLSFFQSSDKRTLALVLSRNTDLSENATTAISFLGSGINWTSDFQETFCDTTFSFPDVTLAVFPQPFLNTGKEIVRILASDRDYKPISSILDIYSVNNTLIRHIDVLPEAFGGNYYQSWDGRDDAGNLAQSGIYYYSILTDGLRASGKIAVVRK